jgi:hypothetical protein
MSSGLPVNRWCDRAYSLGHIIERFRVTHQKVTSGLERSDDTVHHLLLGFGAEVNHDIAQKNDIKLSQFWQWLIQVCVAKLDSAAQTAFYQ